MIDASSWPVWLSNTISLSCGYPQACVYTVATVWTHVHLTCTMLSLFLRSMHCADSFNGFLVLLGVSYGLVDIGPKGPAQPGVLPLLINSWTV